MRLLLAHPIALALAASTLLALTSAHSWLECTDYRIDQNSEDAKTWNPSKCQGRARCTGSVSDPGFTFGLDKGFDSHSDKCQCARGSEKDSAPKATYTPGQRVCLAYPPKNHVAAPCTNQYIPDAGVRITRSKVSATSDDETPSKSYTQGNGDHVSDTIDYKGFQHCPNFCSNEDKALCTMCFDLESDLAPGEYSFKWIWDFHGQGDIYTSCWEASVGGKSNGQQLQSNSSAGNNYQATVATGNPVSYVASPASTPEATQAAPTPAPSPTPTAASPTPTVTSSSPSSTPTVYAAVAGEADADCEDELDVAGEDDCQDELNMAGTNGADTDCEEELDMATGNNEVGADADPAYGGNSNGQSADHASPSADAPATTEAAQSPGTGGNYGGGAGGQEPDVQSHPAAAATGSVYGHENGRNPATGGGHESAPSPATGGAQTPSSGNNTPASNNGYGVNSNNNQGSQGSTHHGHEYGHSNGGHYPLSHGNNSKHHGGQQAPATSTDGQSQSTPATNEADPGCEQGLTLAKDKPTETSGGNSNNNGKAVDTPVAYPSESQSLEAAPSPPAPTPETRAEAQSYDTATPPTQATSTPETGAEADHGQGYGHEGQGHPASDSAAAATPEPDCDETLSVAEPASPAPAADVSGESNTVTEDPDCEEKLPYAYGNKTPAAVVQGEADSSTAPEVQGEANEDCDKGIPIASEAPGQGGGHHGPHHRNHYQGESYSFTSEQKALEGGGSANNNRAENGAGVVMPYPGE